MTHVQPPDPVAQLFQRARAALAAATVLAEVTRANRQAARAARAPIIARAELIRASQTARLMARLQTMPVIEQAKGIIMGQSGCTAETAFDMLRQASQRSNVPIREIAASIVTKAAERSSTPVGPTATRAMPVAADHEHADADAGEPTA